LLLLLGIGGYTTYRLLDNQPKEIIGGTYLPDPKDAQKMSKKERQKAAEQEVDASKFTLSLYPEATFENGQATGDIYIRNEVTNAYPIAVEIIEDTTGEVVYESGAIEPGYEITEGKLTKNLGKGTHKCTAKVSIFDPKTKKYRGQTAAEIDIHVKS